MVLYEINEDRPGCPLARGAIPHTIISIRLFTPAVAAAAAAADQLNRKTLVWRCVYTKNKSRFIFLLHTFLLNLITFNPEL